MTNDLISKSNQISKNFTSHVRILQRENNFRVKPKNHRLISEMNLLLYLLEIMKIRLFSLFSVMGLLQHWHSTGQRRTLSVLVRLGYCVTARMSNWSSVSVFPALYLERVGRVSMHQQRRSPSVSRYALEEARAEDPNVFKTSRRMFLLLIQP